jgi:hypothetical protein
MNFALKFLYSYFFEKSPITFLALPKLRISVEMFPDFNTAGLFRTQASTSGKPCKDVTCLAASTQVLFGFKHLLQM